LNKYTAKIKLSYRLEEQELGDLSWSDKFNKLHSDPVFSMGISDFLNFDLETQRIFDPIVQGIEWNFSETEECIDVIALLGFGTESIIEDDGSDEFDEVMWELKNGLVLMYSDHDGEEYNFLADLDNSYVESWSLE